MFMLSAFQDKCTYAVVFLLCLLELLVVKSEVKLEKKTAYGKNKGSELFFWQNLNLQRNMLSSSSL